MPYFILKHAVNTQETGTVYPQIQKMSSDYDYYAPNSVYALSRETESLPDYSPNLDSFVLNGRAKLTDLLSTSVIHGGILISEKLKAILEQSNLPTHKFYRANIRHKNQLYSYYWMHIICDLTNYIDYQRSVFFVYNNFSTNLGTIEIQSKEDFIQKKMKIKSDNPGKTVTIWAEKITFNKSYKLTLDLFEIGLFDSNYYISSQIKERLSSEKITGYAVLEAKNLKTY